MMATIFIIVSLMLIALLIFCGYEYIKNDIKICHVLIPPLTIVTMYSIAYAIKLLKGI